MDNKLPVHKLVAHLSTKKCIVKCTTVFALTSTEGRRDEEGGGGEC
jgi:hypothetical protein